MSETHLKTAALTGGIASGKSTVSRIFQELGVYVIDADLIARQVVEPGQSAWKEIVERFGQDILLGNKQIDRKKLGAIIFHQPEERRVLNQITHPKVIEHIDREIQAIHTAQADRLILVDVPLLIEASMQNDYATIIVVYVPEDIQLARLIKRDNISKQEALAKIRAQMPLSEKVKYATHLIKNDKSLDNTREQVIAVYQAIS